MARALITGVGGFTGRYLATRLAKTGYEVHGTVHDQPLTDIPGVWELHAVDISNAEAMAAVVTKVTPDVIVHLAAIAFVAHADISDMYRTNIFGTRNLLEAVARARKQPGAVVLASSANIYGSGTEGVLDESTPPAPSNDYAVTKAAGEYVAGLFRKRLPLIVVRPFNYTGRGQSNDFLVPKIVAHARTRKPEIELGNVDVSRDFSDVRAVVHAYARLLETADAVGGTFNVCSGRAISLASIIDMVQEISGHQMQIRINPAFVRADDVRTLAGSPRLIEQTIGPLQMPPFRETLRWMLEE